MRLTVLILTVTCIAWQIPEGENSVIIGKALHHRMTREEIKHFFGVERPQDVPDYDVALPYQANEEGHFASYSLNPARRKRSVNEDENGASAYYYNINVLGERVHLHVKRNTKFMAPGLQLETRDQDGRPIRRAVSKSTYLTGKVVSDPNSVVALSVSDGMTGFVKRSRDTFVVHPLPAHLARHVRGEEGAKPHIIYSRSDVYSFTCETDKTTNSAKRDTIQNQLDDNGNGGLINKYLEVALLADEQVVATHGNKTEEFLLLIACVVDSIFQGPSAGAIKINYVVTRLVFITNEELGIDPSDSSVPHRNVIEKLGVWARKNNSDDESDPLQFDVASLIRSGGAAGLAAVVNKVCSHKDLVNVNSDNGLQTAYSIAHETGHNLLLNHDGTSGCPNRVNIMSSTLVGGPKALDWSSCSRDALQTFLSSDDSSCLDDLPPSTRPKPPASFYTKLPGEIEDADTQCAYQYGPGYRQCPQRESYCNALYCTPDEYSCFSHDLRPLEGTACGPGKWCIRGGCVDNGLPKIDGGWSKWSNYMECSRSCDGGVRYRERTCTSPPPQNGGENCAGPSKEWEICNTNVECPQSPTTFRDQMCKQIDSSFSSYHVEANPCSLACRSGNTYSFYGNVVDGTRCSYADPSIYDVCIQGICQKVGCDHVFKSGKMRDRCGVCDGIGDTCTYEKSTYTKSLPNYGYGAIDIITILPVNTTHALFEEKSATYNLLGVQDEKGNNLIPIPSWWGKVIYAAGTKITYTNDANYPDRLEITGPTNMILRVVYVQVYQTNVGIEYQYLRPLQENEDRVPGTCHWLTDDWTVCSSGQQTREVYCARSDNFTGNTYVTSARADCCEAESRPDAVKLCLQYGWFREWETCSKTCGKGSQSQSVVCRAKVNATHYNIDESEASCNATLKPNTESRDCNNVKCPAKWTTSWSECSNACLLGNKTGIVKCSRTNELGETEDVSDIQCEYEPRPPTFIEPCNDDNSSDPCQVYEIGCFKTPSGLFSETLGDLTQESNSAYVLAQCKELTRRKSYTVFALGRGGLCMSGPQAQDDYFKYKTPSKKNRCSNGIGKGGNSVVYTFGPPPELEAIGCYKDKGNDRALPTLYVNFRPYINWSNLNETILGCAFVARDIGYEYFGVQFYGECWSSDNATDTYAKHGVQTNSKECVGNVGGRYTNFVYRIPLVESQA